MRIKSRRFQLFFISLMLFVLVFTTGCVSSTTTTAVQSYKPVTLVYWRTWDDEDVFSDVIKAYKAQHPNVTIEYRKFRYEEYEKALLEAFAQDRGPDLFSIHNTWMRRYEPMMLELPAKTVTPVKRITGTIKKVEVIEQVTKNSLTPTDMRRKFLEVVAQDMIFNKNVGTAQKPQYQEKVWGLPLSVDTLVMYYNKDILNNAGIVEPATTWTEFRDQVKSMTKVDPATGTIQISGAAIGTADNVARSSDILSLLMMQNLAPMLDDNGNASFDKRPRELAGTEIAPAQGALEFYTQFASPLYEGYSWNNEMPNSLDAFTKGQVGYFFGYSYNRDTIIASAPKLRFNIAPVPQVGEQQKVNFANYWAEVVSKKTKNKDFAWDFLQFITDEANVSKYLDKAKKPTALRSAKIINEQLADENLAVFADQLLTARSWYRGFDSNGAEKVFGEMINAVLKGELTPAKSIQQAVDKINIAIRRRPL
ncbi:extracellular solute-binding protein [Patescibacteria group bacterium]|nr:extracellular solute-binding protein [Patescibacteria group bacterium]